MKDSHLLHAGDVVLDLLDESHLVQLIAAVLDVAQEHPRLADLDIFKKIQDYYLSCYISTFSFSSYLKKHLTPPLGQPGGHNLKDGDEVGHEGEPLLNHLQAHLAAHRAGQVALTQQQLGRLK